MRIPLRLLWTHWRSLSGIGAVLFLTALAVNWLAGSAARWAAVDPLVRLVSVGSSPVALALDTRRGLAIVADATDGHIWAVHTGSGTVAWEARLGAQPLAVFPVALALDTQRSRVFILALDGTVYTLDLERGAPVGAAPPPSSEPIGLAPGAYLAIDVAAGRVFAVNPANGTVLIVDALTGLPLRAVQAGVAPVIRIDEGQGLVLIAPALSGSQSLILDLRTGRTLAAAPATPCGTVTVSATRPFTLDLGARSWSIALHATRCTLLLNAESVLAADAALHRLFMLDTSRGTVLMFDDRGLRSPRLLRVPARATALALDPLRHRLLIASSGPLDALGRALDDGSLTVLDTRSGLVLQVRRVAITPLAVAFDGLRDRALVLAGAGGPAGLSPSYHGTQAVLDRLRTLLSWLPFGRSASQGGTLSVLNGSLL